MINLVITDDHKMVNDGLASMLSSDSEIIIENTFLNGQDLLEYLSTSTPDVLLLDINLPDINGLEICKIVTRLYPSINTIGLTNFNEISFTKAMMRNGAKGYLLKNTDKEELITAIKTVVKGEIFLPSKLQSRLLEASFGVKSNSFIPKLTRREKEVLAEIAEEFTNQEIADKLFISIKTVESHRNNLLQKFEVRNTAGLIKKAYIKGLL